MDAQSGWGVDSGLRTTDETLNQVAVRRSL
jgi:hypothetical protein